MDKHHDKGNDSYIQDHAGGMSFVGPDAVQFFAACSLRTAIDMYLRAGIRASRMHTPANMLKAATAITRKEYKRGQLQQASSDLNTWIVTMRAALPRVNADGKQS